MSTSFDDWVSIFDDELKTIWSNEKETELKKVSMLLCAFFKEVKGVQNVMTSEISRLRYQVKEKNYLKKDHPRAIVESEAFVLPFLPDSQSNKENTNIMINSSPEKQCPKSPESSDSDFQLTNSPVFKRFVKPKISPKDKKNATKQSTTTPSRNVCDESFCLIDGTPEMLTKQVAKTSKSSNSSQISKRKSKSSQKSSKNKLMNKTLTQMLGEPEVVRKPSKKKRVIDSHGPSMNIDEILDVIDDSFDNSTTTQVQTVDNDETIDDLCNFISPLMKKDGNNSKQPTNPATSNTYQNKQNDWSCEDCKNYYGVLKLSPKTRATKQDECFNFHTARNDKVNKTMSGFWDLTFKDTQDSQESLCFLKLK